MSVQDSFNNKLRTDKNDLADTKANRIVFIKFDDLVPSEENRKIFIVDDELKEAIKEDGLLNPLNVARLDNGKYEIISGNRRYEAFKSILATNKDFTYSFASDKKLNPFVDGLPCIVNERTLTKNEKGALMVEHNKSRILDRLEIYQMVKFCEECYLTDKENGEDVGRRKRDYIANKTPVSSGTIQSIIDDDWLINSHNYEEIKKLGSYVAYAGLNKDKKDLSKTKSKGSNSGPIKTSFKAEKSRLDKLVEMYSNKDISNDVDQDEFEQLATIASELIVNLQSAFKLNTSNSGLNKTK